MNKVLLIGRLTRKPELKYIAGSNQPVITASVAVNESWKDAQGNKKEHTEFFDCSAFGGLANFMGQYCDKGDLLYIEGRFRTSSYQKKDGTQAKSMKVMIEVAKKLNVTPRNEFRTDHAETKSASQLTDQPMFDEDIPF